MFQRLILTGLFLSLPAFCQESSPKRGSSKSAAKKADAKAEPKQAVASAPAIRPDGAERVDEMPKDVVEVRTDVFRHVDGNGKAWIYRRMPIGLFRSAETEYMRKLIADPPDKLKVRELPDGSLEFTKMTPFGPGRYTRKKVELTEEEKTLWEDARQEKSAGTQKKEGKEQQK